MVLERQWSTSRSLLLSKGTRDARNYSKFTMLFLSKTSIAEGVNRRFREMQWARFGAVVLALLQFGYSFQAAPACSREPETAFFDVSAAATATTAPRVRLVIGAARRSDPQARIMRPDRSSSNSTLETLQPRRAILIFWIANVLRAS